MRCPRRKKPCILRISRFDGYGFVNYKINDDAAAGYVRYIFEDSKGVFWIALYNGGLYRFDPNHEDVSAAGRPTGTVSDDGRIVMRAKLINDAQVRVLYEDPQGNLWVGADGFFRTKSALLNFIIG